MSRSSLLRNAKSSLSVVASEGNGCVNECLYSLINCSSAEQSEESVLPPPPFQQFHLLM